MDCTAGHSDGGGGAIARCHTICGDGIRAGREVCDDGNHEKFDGCSSNCDPCVTQLGRAVDRARAHLDIWPTQDPDAR